MGDTCRKQLPVARTLSDRILAALAGGSVNSTASTTTTATDETVLLPTFEGLGDHDEHQDQYPSGPSSGEVVDGRVGLVYLEGDGDFVLTDTATGAEHRLRIKPGRLISWPNANFTHRVENASTELWRSMFGPVTFDKGWNELVDVGPPPEECVLLRGYTW